MNEMFDIGSIMKIKGAWDTFTRNHPKFMPFMQAVGRAFRHVNSCLRPIKRKKIKSSFIMI